MSSNLGNPTIAAISTAPGRAAVAVVRTSGAEAFALAERLLGKQLQAGRITVADFRGEKIVVLPFRGPASYTGEDVVEYQCHGGTFSPRRLLEACYLEGALPAARGEFTRRAFLNGRLPLESAQAVIDLIDAKTVRAGEMALLGLQGSLQTKMTEFHERLMAISTELEHALDVSEVELAADFLSAMDRQLAGLIVEVAAERRKLGERQLLKRGALVVLAGPPNAGKSSLLNALLGEARALVSDEPGTTRDFIEGYLDIGGYPVRLIDTAGLRYGGRTSAVGEVEAAGVARAEELIGKADVVLAFEGIKAPPSAILLQAKCDLNPVAVPGRVRVSAVSGEGLSELRSLIAARLEELAHSMEESGEAGDWLTELLALERDLPKAEAERELLLKANAVRFAAMNLGAALGKTYSEELLERMFSRFCVGK